MRKVKYKVIGMFVNSQVLTAIVCLLTLNYDGVERMVSGLVHTSFLKDFGNQGRPVSLIDYHENRANPVYSFGAEEDIVMPF